MNTQNGREGGGEETVSNAFARCFEGFPPNEELLPHLHPTEAQVGRGFLLLLTS